MLAHAIDLEPFAAVGEHVADGLADAIFGIEALAALVDDRRVQRFGALDLAAVGLQLAEQQLDQRRFAGAVGADDADAIAAADAQRQVGNDGAAAETLADMMRVDQHLGLAIVAGRGDFRHGIAGRHRLAGGAQLDQLGKPAFVAAAPGGDAAQQPMFLGLELGIELGGVLGFLGGDPLRPFLEAAEADFGAAQRAAIQPQAVLGQPGQEGAVMADRQHAAVEAVQPVFQPFDGGDIEMVGRLVEQQQVRLFGQGADQRGAAAFPARSGGGIAVEIGTETRGDRIEQVIGRGVMAGSGIIPQRGKAGEVGVLLQPHDLEAGRHGAAAFVELDFSGDELEQRGLANAVAADQRQPVTGIDGQVKAAEQPVAALAQAGVFKGENGFGHDRSGLAVASGGKGNAWGAANWNGNAPRANGKAPAPVVAVTGAGRSVTFIDRSRPSRDCMLLIFGFSDAVHDILPAFVALRRPCRGQPGRCRGGEQGARAARGRRYIAL